MWAQSESQTDGKHISNYVTNDFFGWKQLWFYFFSSTNVVMNYSDVESKVREATNDEAWGPHGSLMLEVAQFTFTYEHFPEVMGMLWKRMLHDNKKNWRRVYKVLSIHEFLL